jgi:hypothetical protein
MPVACRDRAEAGYADRDRQEVGTVPQSPVVFGD